MWLLFLPLMGIGIAVVALSVHALRRDGMVRRRLDAIEQTLSVVEQTHTTVSPTDGQQADAGASPQSEAPQPTLVADDTADPGRGDQASRFLKDTTAAFASSPVATAALIVAGAATALLGVGQLPSNNMHDSIAASPMPESPIAQSPAPVAAAPVEKTPRADDTEPASDEDDADKNTEASRDDAAPPPPARTPDRDERADPPRENDSGSDDEETPPAEHPDEEMLCGNVSTDVGDARACIRDLQSKKSTLL